MKTVDLYRRDFKDVNPGESFFEDILISLSIPKSEWDSIDKVCLNVESFEIEED